MEMECVLVVRCARRDRRDRRKLEANQEKVFMTTGNIVHGDCD